MTSDSLDALLGPVIPSSLDNLSSIVLTAIDMAQINGSERLQLVNVTPSDFYWSENGLLKAHIDQMIGRFGYTHLAYLGHVVMNQSTGFISPDFWAGNKAVEKWAKAPKIDETWDNKYTDLAHRICQLTYHFSVFPRIVHACRSLGVQGGWLRDDLDDYPSDFKVNLSDLTLPFCLVRHDQYGEEPWRVHRRLDFDPRELGDSDMVLGLDSLRTTFNKNKQRYATTRLVIYTEEDDRGMTHTPVAGFRFFGSARTDRPVPLLPNPEAEEHGIEGYESIDLTSSVAKPYIGFARLVLEHGFESFKNL